MRHMRTILHLATLVLFADRFVISPFLLSTFYFLLPTSYLCFVVSTLYIVCGTMGPCSAA